MDDVYVRILKEARRLIECGDERFVCHAITRAAWNKKATVEGTELRDWIRDSLEGSYSVAGWLVLQGIREGEMTAETLKDYRLRWIDNMIEEWQK